MAHTSKVEWHCQQQLNLQHRKMGRKKHTLHSNGPLKTIHQLLYVSASHLTSSIRSKSEWDLIVGVSVMMSEVWRAYERKRSHPALRGVALGQSSICFEWRRKNSMCFLPLYSLPFFVQVALSLWITIPHFIMSSMHPTPNLFKLPFHQGVVRVWLPSVVPLATDGRCCNYVIMGTKPFFSTGHLMANMY